MVLRYGVWCSLLVWMGLDLRLVEVLVFCGFGVGVCILGFEGGCVCVLGFGVGWWILGCFVF